MRPHLVILAALAVLMSTPGVGGAQRDFPWGLGLSYPSGVRTMGMGTTGVADNTDPSNIYFNPANVVGAPRAYLRGSRWDWASDDNETVIEGGGGWEGTVAGRQFLFGVDATVGILDFSQVLRTIYVPEGSDMPIPGENFIGLTFGAGTTLCEHWDARLAVGAKRYWEDDHGQDPPQGYGFDAGTTAAYRAVAAGWNITPAAALAFVNLGAPLKEADQYRYRLPARFHYGFSVRIESPRVEINKTEVPLIAITCNLDGTDPFYGLRSSWAFGSEFALAQILFVRAGTVFEEGNSYFDSSVSGSSALGVGIGCPIYSACLRFDYAKLPSYIVAGNRYQLYLEF